MKRGIKKQVQYRKPICKNRASYYQLSHELCIDVAKLMSLHKGGVLLPVAYSPHGLMLFDRQKARAILKAIGHE